MHQIFVHSHSPVSLSLYRLIHQFGGLVALAFELNAGVYILCGANKHRDKSKNTCEDRWSKTDISLNTSRNQIASQLRNTSLFFKRFHLPSIVHFYYSHFPNFSQSFFVPLVNFTLSMGQLAFLCLTPNFGTA